MERLLNSTNISLPTPLPANFSQLSLQSKLITEYLKGNWSLQAEQEIQKLFTEIAVLNSTRLDPVTLGDVTSWLSSAFSYFKGMGGNILVPCINRLWRNSVTMTGVQTKSPTET